MISRFRWVLAQFTERFWFHLSLYGIGAALVVALAEVGAPYMPDWVVQSVTDGAANELLQILASSMLVVATFALGTMVQAYAAAASAATPRATTVLIADAKSQRVLATFLGAFVFAIVGLLFQAFGYYNPAGDTVVLAATAVVVAIVLATLFGWLDHLVHLVRLGDTIRKVEARVSQVIERRAQAPCLGGVAASGAPETNWTIGIEHPGYIQLVDAPKLQAVAERAGGYIAVECLPGALARPNRPLARLSWEASDKDRNEIRDAFVIEDERSFDQDPRFGLIVLCEIASRALSPGVNDPGTAIAVVGAQQRLLMQWARDLKKPRDPAPCDRVSAPELQTQDLFDDAFGPLTRDAAPIIEVGVRLQKALASLAEAGPADYAPAAHTISGKALRHADKALALEEDRALLTELAAALGGSEQT